VFRTAKRRSGATSTGWSSSTTWPIPARGSRGGHLLTTVGRIIYNDKIERALEEAPRRPVDPSTYVFMNRSMKKKDTTKLVDDLVQAYGAPSISQVLDAFKDVGFQYATRAGV